MRFREHRFGIATSPREDSEVRFTPELGGHIVRCLFDLVSPLQQSRRQMPHRFLPGRYKEQNYIRQNEPRWIDYLDGMHFVQFIEIGIEGIRIDNARYRKAR